MKAMPTLEGGLRLDMENAVDWLMLEHIVVDATGDDASTLPERLGALMDEASDWDEVVVPELQAMFSGQVAVVARMVREAHEQAREAEEDGLAAPATVDGEEDGDAGEECDGEGGELGDEEADGEGGTLFIKREDAEAWYGALNQARLGLEARFQFGPSEVVVVEDLAGFSEEKVGGFFRMRFYTRLQGLLLDYAME